MPSQNKQQKDMQWEVDNLTYSLTKGELTMAQCTDKILQLFKSYAAAERLDEQERTDMSAMNTIIVFKTGDSDYSYITQEQRIQQLQERITQ